MSKASEPAGSPGKSGKLNFAQRIVSHIDASSSAMLDRTMLLPSSKQTRSKRRLEDAARRGLKRIKIIKMK